MRSASDKQEREIELIFNLSFRPRRKDQNDHFYDSAWGGKGTQAIFAFPPRAEG